MTTDGFLAHFNSVQAAGDSQWLAFCPVHPDGSKRGARSFSISRGDGSG